MITHHIPYERLYFSIPDGIIHIVIVYGPLKMFLKNILFFAHGYFSDWSLCGLEILIMY